MSQVMIDQGKASAFAEKMLGVLNSAAVALMTSIGHRTGLFDTLSEMPPSTSEDIASRAGLHERYVREWLGAMVTGGIVEYDEKRGTYALPPEHAAYLTRAATPDNIAVTTQYVSLLGTVEDPIIQCFRNGGGVPYPAFKRFHAIMAEESAQTVIAGLRQHILPLAPGLEDRLHEGIDVLDIGCGSGRAMNYMAREFPKSRFAGYDFSEEGIGNATEEARRVGTRNVRFEVCDAASLGEESQYDLITAFDAIHDQADPAAVLRNIHRALRPGGTFLMQDIAGSSHVHNNVEHPIGPFIYTISCMHCMTVSLAAGGAGLGAMWGRELAEKMLHEAGFHKVRVEQLEHDFINYYYIAEKE